MNTYIRLRQWAMRAADHINGQTPARCPHLGSACDYAATYMGHLCRCGHRPVTWDAVMGDVTARIAEFERNGLSGVRA